MESCCWFKLGSQDWSDLLCDLLHRLSTAYKIYLLQHYLKCTSISCGFLCGLINVRSLFFLIWACGSSWTRHRLEVTSFHGGAVVFENDRWSVVGKFDRNVYNLAVMASTWGTAKISELRSCSKWCPLSEYNGLMMQDRFSVASWHWKPRTFSVQLLIASNSSRVPAHLFPFRLIEMGAVNSSSLLCRRMTIP